MISSISMKNVAVYNQKTEISHCKKINLIYGNNGTGKTLLSNYLSDPTLLPYANCIITWEDNKPLPTYVFNRKFCISHFRKANVPGIFTLGRENVNIENRVEDIKKELTLHKKTLSNLQNEYDFLNEQRDKLQTVCINSLWERAKTYKQLLGIMFRKPQKKDYCFMKVQTVFYEDRPYVPSLLELKQKADILKSQKKIRYSILPNLDASRLAAIENEPIWGKPYSIDNVPVLSNSRDNEIVAKWIRQGLHFIGKDNKCPFCEQEVPDQILQERMKYQFSEKYSQQADQYNRLSSQYEILTQKFLNNAERILKQSRDENLPFVDAENFSNTLNNLRNLFHANLLFMIRKRDISGQSGKIQSCLEFTAVLNQMIKESNYQANQANILMENLKKGEADLLKDSWNSYSKESQDDIQNFNSAVFDIDPEIAKLKIQIEQIKALIQDLEYDKEMLLRNSINIRDSVDKINEELFQLGTSNLHLQLSETENHYNILRDDGTSAAETLSEGERTLIMLLYFLQLVEGSSTKEDVKTDRIIVIDDPVSNLDDAMLNAVMERIGKLISRILDGDQYIQQLFVLSHRRECTKKLRVCDSRLENEQNIGLWILKKKNGVTHAQEYI